MDRSDLTRLPAFVEEAFGNVSLKNIIAAHLAGNAPMLQVAVIAAVDQYADEWIADTMTLRGYSEAEAIAYGMDLFSNPAAAVGL